MNGSTQESTLPPEANAVKRGVDWVAKHWPRVRLGHEGMMLEKIQRQNRIVEIDARNTMTGKVDDVADWPESEGEEMGVDIGDTIHNYYSTPPPPAEPPPAQPKSQFPKLLAKAAITAALVGSGVGGGTIALGLLGMFDKTPPPVVAPPAEEWTDRVLENYVPPQGGSE